MKLQFKHQKFQADAAKAVCDVFAGQPCLTPSYMMDRGYVKYDQMTTCEAERFTGFGNSRLMPELNDGVILENINKIQRRNMGRKSGFLSTIPRSLPRLTASLPTAPSM